MKVTTVVIFALLVVVTVGDKSHENRKKEQNAAVKQCITNENADPELTNKAIKGEDFNDDVKVKCVLKCFLIKIKVMDSNGKPQLDGILSKMDDDEAKGALTKCNQIKEEDACEAGSKLYKCILEYQKQYAS